MPSPMRMENVLVLMAALHFRSLGAMNLLLFSRGIPFMERDMSAGPGRFRVSQGIDDPSPVEVLSEEGGLDER